MTIKNLMIITAVILFISGLIFLIAPAPFLAVSDIKLDAGTTYLARLFGLAFIATGIISWLLKDSKDNKVLRAYCIAAFVQTGIGLIVCLQAVISGTVNANGWSNVVIYGFFAIGYGYFLFAKNLMKA